MKQIANHIMLLLCIVILSMSCKPKVPQILIPKDATTKESLAASEIRRYIYLRTGLLAEISAISTTEMPSSGKVILLERKGQDQVPCDLQLEEYYLKSSQEGALDKLVVSG